MTWSIEFLEEAEKDMKKLDHSAQVQVLKGIRDVYEKNLVKKELSGKILIKKLVTVQDLRLHMCKLYVCACGYSTACTYADIGSNLPMSKMSSQSTS